MNLGQRIKIGQEKFIFNWKLYHSTFFMPIIGSFGSPIRIKYKLELDHVIRVAVNKHVFVETKFTYLHVTSTCSQYIVAGRKARNQATYGSNCFSFRFICGAKNKRWRKSDQELGLAENWAPYCTVSDTVQILCKMLKNFSYLKANVKLLYKH